MISASLTLPDKGLPSAAGHVRAALERVGIEDLFLIKHKDGFRARGVRGRSATAVAASCTPLALTGYFARCAVEVQARPSLNEGDAGLRLTVRVRTLREFDDHEEVDFVTRGPIEMFGDALQGRRVMGRVMESLTEPTDVQPETFDRAADPAERRARFKERYRKGKARRRWQLVWAIVAIGVISALDIWLRG